MLTPTCSPEPSHSSSPDVMQWGQWNNFGSLDISMSQWLHLAKRSQDITGSLREETEGRFGEGTPWIVESCWKYHTLPGQAVREDPPAFSLEEATALPTASHLWTHIHQALEQDSVPDSTSKIGLH